MPKPYSSIRRVSILVGLLGTVGLFVAWTSDSLPKAHAYHDEAELREFRDAGLPLSEATNYFFAASGKCVGCHGKDEVNNYAGIDEDGVDVNVTDDWRSTMMGNSAHDPFWRAKVSHEVTVNPAHKEVLEDKCTSCHAPMGRYNEFYLTGLHYTMDTLANDSMGLDGVSCLACHMQKADSIGLHFSGKILFDTNRVAYGPYTQVFGAPMSNFVGYDPVYGAHINDAGLCASCHTLITETADLAGVPSGDEFVEQATYHEWVNSAFDTDANPESGVTCQGCHVPRIDDAVVISANYLFLQGKSPYGMHHFAGANTFMLELLKNNSEALNLTASSTQFDSTIARTNRMLKQNSLLLNTVVSERYLDTAYIDVSLTNLAGHKFPSGYPARRAFVEVLVKNANNDTIFHSGGWNASTYEVNGHDASWEPHYDVITSPDQAQIYEMVMADVTGNKTTVLERAKFSLKDNRLAPLGFSTTHYAYDTAVIAGVPATDIDFNHYANGIEGSGTDAVHYHVPMNGYTGLLNIETKFWYQSAPPRWMEEMFDYNTPAIDAFRDMYEAASPTPVLVNSSSIVDLNVGIDDLDQLGVRIFPNPVSDGLVRVEGITKKVTSVEVFDLNGKLIGAHRANGSASWQLQLPKGSATYLVVVRTADQRFVERVVVL